MTATPAAPAAATEERVSISVPVSIRGTATIELSASEIKAIVEDQIPADERVDYGDPIEAGIEAWIDNTLSDAVIEAIYPDAESVSVDGADASCDVDFGDVQVEVEYADLTGLWKTTKSARITLAK